MRTIVGKLVLTVAGFIGVVGNVVPAALVDAAGHFAQTVHDGIRSHPVGPAAFLSGEKGHRPGGNWDLLHHTVGGQGSAKTEMLDHKRETSCWNSFSQTLWVCQCSPLCRLWRHLFPARGESFSVRGLSSESETGGVDFSFSLSYVLLPHKTRDKTGVFLQ